MTKDPLRQRRTKRVRVSVKAMASPFIPPSLLAPQVYPMPAAERTLDDLSAEVQQLFQGHLPLREISKKLQHELRQHLVSSPQCMLPSYTYNLPTGEEKGIYLALEVGGSNLRTALVELAGRTKHGNTPLGIRRAATYPIEKHIRQLEGLAFFDWMAERIRDMLSSESTELSNHKGSQPLPMGIAWSFPVELVGCRRHTESC